MKLSNSLGSPRNHQKGTGAGAFTLVELLVVVAIIATISGLGGAAYHSAQVKGRMAREVSAGKTLITAFQAHAVDNNGLFIPAVDKFAGSRDRPVWFEPYQRNITSMKEAPHRYPFRLAPYFNYKLNGVILLPENTVDIEKIFNKIGKANSFSDYGVSLAPAFGMNLLIGGEIDSSGAYEFGSTEEAVTRQAQADVRLLVFASAAGTDGGEGTLSGFFKVTSPRVGAGWSAEPWSTGANPGYYGAVDARHDGKAVCVFLDGSVEMKGVEELRDMRLWSRNAFLNDDKNYVPVK